MSDPTLFCPSPPLLGPSQKLISPFLPHLLQLAYQCTRRVLVCAYYYGLEDGKDFTFNEVDFDQIKTKEWIARQPFRQMPLLEDAGFVLYGKLSIDLGMPFVFVDQFC